MAFAGVPHLPGCSMKPLVTMRQALEDPDLLEGRELYLWLPAGQIESPLRKSLTDKRLGTAATNRNWNTLAKMGQMLDD